MGVQVLHLRRFRCIGLAKTHLQHVLTAAAMSLIRLVLGSAAHRSRKTRQSAFIKLMMLPIGA